ncbi:AT-rich interactive domain-containing protein 3B-like isoform X1 [Hippoglossus hippoglossus]|uniref:AT-rich interactive domain-containing protein 3B-like isoform X1 n=2 Tax=Hippoglossus TaxID=8266 RepID=UPI00148D3347|nr:AT-rich interactive domain-containing protein 3B-like isoform X1 [Hippoglossus hippoglossus]XP_035007412.1 AT-rich interactive domain-containing protein 3B isoform X1 [Hippoglossus stenolepis]
MVDNSNSSKAQMPSMSQEPGVAFPQSTSTGGMKLEAVMEQLQRQQQARLEMERKERKLREAHIMYAQQVAAQQAILAAARASGATFMGKSLAGVIPGGGLPPRVSNQSSVDSEREDDEDRGRDSGDEDDDNEMMEGDEGSDEDEGSASGLEFLRKQTLALQQSASRIPSRPFGSYSASAPQRAASPPIRVKQEPDEGLSPAGPHSATSPNGQADWGFEDHFRQNGSAGWADEADSSRGRGEASRDFAKLYELDSDPKRKEFLDDLFTFMQKRGTPVNRIPIMAKQVLDLYMLYKLVTEKGGLVEVINKKIWREITKGLNLPTSITSAAFTLRTQYMKYLYPYECERKGLSSPGELQAAIDSNRREGRRPSYSSSLFRFSPSPSTAPHILSPPKMHLSALGHGTSAVLNGLHASPGPSLKKDDLTSSIMAGRSSMALALGQHQVAGLARAATLEQLREKLETGVGGEGPERKMARLAEEQQRLMQQAFQHNLLAMASQMPMNLRMGAPVITTRDQKQQDMSLSISTNGNASITVSVEVNGTVYSGTLFAHKSAGAPGPAVSAAAATASPAGTSTSFGFSMPPAQTLSPSSSSSSSKGPGSAEPVPSGSP